MLGFQYVKCIDFTREVDFLYLSASARLSNSTQSWMLLYINSTYHGQTLDHHDILMERRYGLLLEIYSQ